MNKIITLFRKVLVPVMITGLIALSNVNSVAQCTGTGTCIVVNQPCNENDGVLITTITSGLTPPLTFEYIGSTNSGTSATIIHSNVNSLIDTLKGTQGCTEVYAYDNSGHCCTITRTGMNAPFSIDNPTVTSAVCPNNTGTAKITINSGTIPDTVKWYQNLSGAPAAYLGKGDPMTLPAGSYFALVIAKGCRAFYPAPGPAYGSPVNGQDSIKNPGIIIGETSNIKYTVTSTKANCTNGTATVSNITGGVAPYIYHWSNSAVTPSVNNLSMGQMYVTVTDAQGCFTSSYTYIYQSITITVTSTIKQPTCKQNDGSVISFGAGGVSPYTFLYSNGITGQTACCLSAGSYVYVWVTDANGCKGEGYAYLTPTTPITVKYTATPSSCTSPTGSATLTLSGGTKPFSINWNTYPTKTGLTISNMNPGTVGFRVIDSVGCVQAGTVVIPPVSTINATIAANNAVCPSPTGAVYVNVSGSNPPFKYYWNNGATTQNILNAPVGSYYCTITDNVGCSVYKYKNVNIASTVGVNLSPTEASCLYASDGSIIASAFGGSGPYTITWSKGLSGFNPAGLMQGYFYAWVTDDNGCVGENHTYVGYNPYNDSCYCTIQGKVYVDQNNNCQYDSGEQGVQNIMIHCSGLGYTFTDANGNYSFLAPTGTYVLSESVQAFYPLQPCQNNSDTVTVLASHGCTSTVNFANRIFPLHDIDIVTTNINQAVSGYNYTQALLVQNDGTQTESNIQLEYQNDGQLQYVNTMPTVFTQPDSVNKPNLYTAFSGFPSLTPGASVKLLTTYQVPVNVPLGTQINFTDTASYEAPLSNWLTDYTPWNNVNTFNTMVFGSFDPNFIEVLPQGVSAEGYIQNTDSVLTYTIHFQNTGTYYAENIVLVDTLDKNLLISTLKPGYADYPFTADMSESGVLKFTFSNIYLPYKSLSDLSSRGMVTFSVKHKPALPDGTKINNNAYVYFDYNAPVLTNTVLNTIEEGRTTGIHDLKQNQSLLVYPNPATNDLFVKINSTYKGNPILSIYDLTGRMLQQIQMNNSYQKISVSNLARGIYFLELSGANGEKSTVKFVKE